MSHKKKSELKPTARLYSRHVSLGVLIPENFSQDLFRLVQQNIPFCFKGFRNPAKKGYIVLEFEVMGTAETRLNKILESFYKENRIAFDKPKILRSRDEIEQTLERAEKLAEKSRDEADKANILLKDEKAIFVKRVGIYHGVIHALSWVLNNKDIGQISPA